MDKPLLIPWIKVFLYQICGHDLMYRFAVLYDWVHRNEVE